MPQNYPDDGSAVHFALDGGSLPPGEEATVRPDSFPAPFLDDAARKDLFDRFKTYVDAGIRYRLQNKTIFRHADCGPGTEPCSRTPQTVSPGDLPLDQYYRLSYPDFLKAVNELETDLHFMQQRRKLQDGLSPGKLQDGLSPGKLVGAIIFRLCRHRLIHWQGDVVCFRGLENTQEEALVLLAMNLLDVRAFSSNWIAKKRRGGLASGDGRGRFIEDIPGEIIYLLKARHVNQEMLAVLFDSLVIMDEAVRDLEPSR